MDKTLTRPYFVHHNVFNKKIFLFHNFVFIYYRLVLPVPQEPLDIQTSEPFHLDQQFSTKWKSKDSYYKYRNKEDFLNVCDIVDKPYVIGVQYKKFKM